MQLEIECPFPGRILFTGLKNYFCSLAKCKDLHRSPVSHYFSLNFLFALNSGSVSGRKQISGCLCHPSVASLHYWSTGYPKLNPLLSFLFSFCFSSSSISLLLVFFVNKERDWGSHQFGITCKMWVQQRKNSDVFLRLLKITEVNVGVFKISGMSSVVVAWIMLWCSGCVLGCNTSCSFHYCQTNMVISVLDNRMSAIK